MDAEKLESNLVKGAPARLLPVVADSKKEERATSTVLATFTVIPDFARAVLSEAGAPIGKRSKIQCFTEVTFKGDSPKSRPDGLIIVTTGKKMWSALVESKVGRNVLSVEQVEDYLGIAKAQGVDAVITISNQFAPLPTHHPVKVNKQKLRSTGLFHFSWLSILSKALLLVDSKTVEDVEQAYILKELGRYLRHESSGVIGGLRMSPGWKNVCTDVHQGVPLKKFSSDVADAVASWHQLQRYLSIQLSVALGKSVQTSMSKKHANDPASRLQDDVYDITTKHVLQAHVEIPHAAGKVELTGDLMRKTLDLSIKLDAPGDTKRQTASINWLTRQLKGCNPENLVLRANWPKRIGSTSMPVEKLLEEDSAPLIPPNIKDMPKSFELIRVVDLGAKFKSVNAFVEISEQELVKYYRDVCQNLTKWIAKPPRVKKSLESSAAGQSQTGEQKLISTLMGGNQVQENSQSSDASSPSTSVSTFPKL
jgi:hypothetical protein